MGRVKNVIFGDKELRGVSREGEEFVRCKLGGDLQFAEFKNCKFWECDFSGCRLGTTSWERCEFGESKLSNLEMSGVKVVKCNFSRAVMTNGILVQYEKRDNEEKKRFSLVGCDFTQANLAGAVFVKADLSKVSFVKANLEKAVFENCYLGESDLRGANIAGVGWNGSRREKTKLDMEGMLMFGNAAGFVLEEGEGEGE